MRKSLLAGSALVCAALLATSAAEARKATYVMVVSPTGATSTSAFGINDNNIIAGSYTDSAGIQHGFYGPPDGSDYTTFDFAGDGNSGTQPRGILNDGTINGIGLGGGFVYGEEFVRLPDGTFKTVHKKKLNFDGVLQGGNDSGMSAGDYIDSDGARVGYLEKGGKYKSAVTLKIKGITSTDPRQINNHGVVGGSYIDSTGIQHGFILDGKKLTSFDYPGAVGVTAPEGINDKGQVTGLWQDSGGIRHGFLYNSTTSDFSEIGPDDGSAHEAWGINNAGMISGDSSNLGVSWIYCPMKKSKCPKGGTAIEVDVHSVHVAPGKLLQALKRAPAHNPAKKQEHIL